MQQRRPVPAACLFPYLPALHKLAIDLEYVSKANLWTDITLIFSTFKAILTE